MPTDEEILASGKKVFLEELHGQVSQLEQGISLEESIQIFHKIKGGAGFFGLNVIKDAASEIEKIAKHKELKEHDLLKFLQICKNFL